MGYRAPPSSASDRPKIAKKGKTLKLDSKNYLPHFVVFLVFFSSGLYIDHFRIFNFRFWIFVFQFSFFVVEIDSGQQLAGRWRSAVPERKSGHGGRGELTVLTRGLPVL